MDQNITEAYVYINGVKIFYRQAGLGPLMFLLHPSPRNSKMMLPLMQELASHFTVIAPDTPGYGFSDRLPNTVQTVYDYIPFFHNFFLSFDHSFLLYGNATGAQLAIAYTIKHPIQVKHLFTDNAVIFTEDETADMIENYFPVIPGIDSNTFIKNMVKQSCLFFPWYKHEATCRIGYDLPPEAIIDDIVNDYLLAGTGYGTAYQAAMLHERPEYLLQIAAPATFFQWQASPVLNYMRRITQANVPSNICIESTPVNMSQRYKIMKDIMIRNCGL